ncbi:MAG: ribosome-binding factor A [Bacteroidota bacterium]
MKKHRAAQRIHGVISTFLQRYYPPTQTHMLISVMEVDLAPDGTNAKVFLSFLPIGVDDRKAEPAVQRIFQLIVDEKDEIKRQIVIQLGKAIRRIPELSFKRDQSARKASRVTQILNSEFSARES